MLNVSDIEYSHFFRVAEGGIVDAPRNAPPEDSRRGPKQRLRPRVYDSAHA